MPLEIRRPRDAAELGAARDLRLRVFCEEQGVARYEEVDGRDAAAVHLVAVQDGAVLGTCRLVRAGDAALFGRLAVEAAERRRGLGRELLLAAEDAARDEGARIIRLHAQVYTRDLYARAGYEDRGLPFVEAGIEHVEMEKPLA